MEQRARFVAEVLDRAAHDRWRGSSVPITGDVADGTWVEVEVSGGVARPIAEPLARAGDALVDLLRLAVEQELDPVFDDAVRAEVSAWEADPGIDDPALVDLEALPFVTIDNADSRDLDQALFIERVGAGHVVRYALADAAHYVPRGSALFAEALRRAASYYLPGWMVPMLPPELSEGLVSLNANVRRRALVFEMHLDAAGACVNTEVVRARILSRAKLTYPGVQRFLDGDAPDEANAEWAESLSLLREVGERRIADAAARDVVRYRRRTVEVGLDERRAFVMFGGLRNDVERYSEQLSLLTNSEGARLLREGDEHAHVQAIYRVHPAPPEDRMRRFAEDLEELASKRGARWRWDRKGGQSLASYLRSLPWVGDELRLTRAVQRQAIMTNVRSTFSDEASGHHGVGADAYARFSAPMREVVGVFLHRELVEFLGGSGSADHSLMEQVIEAANRAKNTQRKVTALSDRLALDQLLARDQARGHVHTGTVMGLTEAKIYVTLDEPPVDVKLYRRNLPDHGKGLGLGRSVRLRVEGRDAKNRWILSPVTPPAGAS